MMCLFTALFHVLPGCPLFILSNREESRTRRSLPPQIVKGKDGSSGWLGGIDAQAGGTWLGINSQALIVAMTNRSKVGTPHSVRSRGLLCRDLLGCPSVDDALQELDNQLLHYPFAGFNVLLLTSQQVVLVENGEEYRMTSLPPGIHTVANGSLNDPADARIQRAQQELEAWNSSPYDLNKAMMESKRICGLQEDKNAPGICVTGSEWGTVSSTILGLTENSADTFYFYADGSPADTDYDDYSAQLRELLSTSHGPLMS